MELKSLNLKLIQGMLSSSSGTTSTATGFSATHYKGDLVYGSWFFANDNTKFLFRPNHDAINRMQSGESVTSTLDISIFEGDGTTNILFIPATISITIEAPQISVNWNQNTDGIINVDSTATRYSDFSGTLRTKFLPSEHTLEIQFEEQKNNENPIVVETGTESDVLDYVATHYAGNFVYGTWFLATDHSKFLFRPNIEIQ